MKRNIQRDGVRYDSSSMERPGVNAFTPGWMQDTLKQMAASRAWVFPLTDRTEVVPATAYPLFLQATSTASLANACHLAVQGAATKAFAKAQQAVFPAVANLVATLPVGTVSFGVRIKISNSVLNASYGLYDIVLQDGAGGTTLAEVFVRPATNVADFVIFGITQNGGQAGVTKITTPSVVVQFATSTLNQYDTLSVESLNERDLGAFLGQDGTSSLSLTDAIR